jgi:hypothetical protein
LLSSAFELFTPVDNSHQLFPRALVPIIVRALFLFFLYDSVKCQYGS